MAKLRCPVCKKECDTITQLEEHLAQKHPDKK